MAGYFSNVSNVSIDYRVAILPEVFPICVNSENEKKKKRKRIFSTVLGYCNNKVASGRGLAKTPVEGKSTVAASPWALASYSHTVVRSEGLMKSQTLFPPGVCLQHWCIVVSTKGQIFSFVNFQVCSTKFIEVVCLQEREHALVKRL